MNTDDSFAEVPISAPSAQDGILDILGMQRHLAALCMSCAGAGWTRPPEGMAAEIYQLWPPTEERYVKMRDVAHRIYDAELGLRALARKTGALSLRLPEDWNLLHIEIILAATGTDPEAPTTPPRTEGRTRKR